MRTKCLWIEKQPTCRFLSHTQRKSTSTLLQTTPCLEAPPVNFITWNHNPYRQTNGPWSIPFTINLSNLWSLRDILISPDALSFLSASPGTCGLLTGWGRHPPALEVVKQSPFAFKVILLGETSISSYFLSTANHYMLMVLSNSGYFNPHIAGRDRSQRLSS